MKVIVKGAFRKDYANKSKTIRLLIDAKITQIERAKNISGITGLLLLEGYTHHYRIKIDNKHKQYRILAIIRNDTVYVLRFIQRRIAYSRLK